MREILFRGFAPSEHGTKTIAVNGEKMRGDWNEGDLIHGNLDTGKQGGENPTCFISMGFGNGFREVIPETVGQYTGKTDIFDNKVFAGDILKGAGTHALVVQWDSENARFEAVILNAKAVAHSDDDYDDYAEACDFNHLSIIGNIWEVEE